MVSVAFTVCCFLSSAHAEPPSLNAATRTATIDALISRVEASYVLPDMAAIISAAMRVKQKNGDYDEVTDREVFANMLTADLRDISRDLHLRVIASDTADVSAPLYSAVGKAERRKLMEARNYGVGTMEILEGNIGYLEMRGFDRVADANPTITAAMTRLADTAALIIDMRYSRGGDPATVSFLSSYLFDARTHLNDVYWREGPRVEQFWTDHQAPGKHFGQQKALYVLTGGQTFSAAEEFCYDLQQLKRATLIGAVTGGGANPARIFALNSYFSASIPIGRAINPISKTNWEGSGVVPDISTPAENALKVAHRLALSKLTAGFKGARTTALPSAAR